MGVRGKDMDTDKQRMGSDSIALIRAGKFVVDVFLCEDGDLGITVDRLGKECPSRDIFVTPDLMVSHDMGRRHPHAEDVLEGILVEGRCLSALLKDDSADAPLVLRHGGSSWGFRDRGGIIRRHVIYVRED
jgi:hypothetical protein